MVAVLLGMLFHVLMFFPLVLSLRSSQLLHCNVFKQILNWSATSKTVLMGRVHGFTAKTEGLVHEILLAMKANNGQDFLPAHTPINCIRSTTLTTLLLLRNSVLGFRAG